MFAQNSFVVKSALSISRAFPDDHIDTSNILMIKLTAPFAFRRFAMVKRPRDSVMRAEIYSGQQYAI